MLVPPCHSSHSEGEDWRHLRSSASKYVVPRRVANYAPGLCEIGDSFVEHLRLKRDSDGYVEDVNSALVKWAFQGKTCMCMRVCVWSVIYMHVCNKWLIN